MSGAVKQSGLCEENKQEGGSLTVGLKKIGRPTTKKPVCKFATSCVMIEGRTFSCFPVWSECKNVLFQPEK